MFLKKYKIIFSLAIPVILSQGMQTVLVLMDRYILSFKDPLLTAVVTSSWFTALSLSSFFIAFISFSTALIGRSFGQQDQKSCYRILTQCFMFSLVFSPIICLLALWGGAYFKVMQHPEVFYNLENDYFRIIMLGYIPLLFKTSIESYLLGIGKSRVIFTASLIGFFLNIGLCYLFVLGPPSYTFTGATGAAVATVTSNCVALIFLLAATSWKIQIQSCFNHLRTLATQSFYAGLEKFSTSFFFVLFMNMFVIYGSETSTAVSIVFTWDQVAFLPLIAIHRSLLSLYSRFVGKNQIFAADRIIHSTLRATLILMAVFSILFLSCSENLIQFFLHGKKTGLDALQIQNMGQTLFQTTACYIFVVACIFIYKAALRSLGFSYWCFKYSFFIHILFTVVSYVSIYIVKVSPYLVWAYFMGMLSLLGLTFILKFYLDPSIRTLRKTQVEVSPKQPNQLKS